MPNLMLQTFTSRLLLAFSVLLFGVLVCNAQESKPDKSNQPADNTTHLEKQPMRDGHDRPTTYPKIHFGKIESTKGEKQKPAADKNLKTRVYLLDVSAVMSKSITVDDTRETTRLEHMVSQMESSLKYLKNRKDPRLRFNIVTFGSVQDFASGGELQAVTPANVKAARKWLKKLKAGGDTDIYDLLKECFEQEPDSATMLVGGMPSKPSGVDEKKFKKYKTPGEFVIAQVKSWRKAGKKTTLDITGVGLSQSEREYYKRLAEAAGGTYLDA
jgi:hypothetical protein